MCNVRVHDNAYPKFSELVQLTEWITERRISHNGRKHPNSPTRWGWSCVLEVLRSDFFKSTLIFDQNLFNFYRGISLSTQMNHEITDEVSVFVSGKECVAEMASVRDLTYITVFTLHVKYREKTNEYSNDPEVINGFRRYCSQIM
ncbi:hypothetical protein J6590_007002 [Homalodisca vitripennis]|nr:hypothetical protein J6590_007002 [Homalodisca vitripennis]